VLGALALETAGAAEGSGVKAALPQVAAGGTAFGPAELAAALSAARSGSDVNYEGASGSVDFDSAGDVSGGFDLWTVNYADGSYKTLEANAVPK
jgi:branched-chain amino acid transport system substrate-binding protein